MNTPLNIRVMWSSGQVESKTYCFICGKKASRTQRIYSNLKDKFAHEEEPVILVGGKDYHEPCCRKCHKF
ncbi:MAG: hypothetical protein Q8855_00820 [Candidatus Phytoplasma australasiaticum]|nr:hypothetical protein [Candidatus Phytoplasma australasiaticum]